MFTYDHSLHKSKHAHNGVEATCNFMYVSITWKILLEDVLRKGGKLVLLENCFPCCFNRPTSQWLYTGGAHRHVKREVRVVAIYNKDHRASGATAGRYKFLNHSKKLLHSIHPLLLMLNTAPAGPPLVHPAYKCAPL